MKALRTPTLALFLCCALGNATRAADSAEASLEILDSDLFNITLFTAQNESALGQWTFQTALSRGDYDLDYRPVSFDLLGNPTQIREKTYTLNLSATRPFKERLALELGAGYRDGFASYRAVWLDTYFDQHFSPLEGVPGHELYQNFQPTASSLATGLKWEYIPANAIASVTISRIQDNVSPGYEIDFDGIRRGQIVLATSSFSLVTENVLTERLRSRLALTASETSAREKRYSAEFALNAALGDKLVWRNRLGATTENPQFDAHFFDTAFEYQFHQHSAIFLQGRHYQDTGEIENALLFTTAAPELENESLSLGLRYNNDNWTAKFALKHSKSDFAPTNPNTDFFQNLYIDSDWLTLQIAVRKTF